MIENHLLRKDKFFCIHLMLTDDCNNRCTYCGQYAPYSEKEFSISELKKAVSFYRDWLQGRNYRFFLEGGEPTLYSQFWEFLEHLSQLGEKVVLLSNGRIPKEKYPIILSRLQDGTIEHIGLHLPVGKEPFAQTRNTEAQEFMEYLYQNGIRKKVIFLWLLHSLEACQKDVWFLLKWFTLFPWLFPSFEVAFPHPSHLKKDYMNYDMRKKAMKYMMKFFDFCIQKNIKINLWGFMLCLMDYGVEINEGQYSNVKDFFIKGKTDMAKSIELHVKNTWETTVLCNLEKNTFLETPSIFSFLDYETYEKDVNERIEQLQIQKEKVPELCSKCSYNGNGCSGDHFNLISQYEASRS